MKDSVVNIGYVVSSSAGTIIASNLDDAYAIGIWMPTTVSTGTSYTIALSPTDTGTYFSTTVYTATPGTVWAGVVSCSSQPAVMLNNVTYRRLRVTATAVESAASLGSWLITKQIHV